MPSPLVQNRKLSEPSQNTIRERIFRYWVYLIVVVNTNKLCSCCVIYCRELVLRKCLSEVRCEWTLRSRQHFGVYGPLVQEAPLLDLDSPATATGTRAGLVIAQGYTGMQEILITQGTHMTGFGVRGSEINMDVCFSFSHLLARRVLVRSQGKTELFCIALASLGPTFSPECGALSCLGPSDGSRELVRLQVAFIWLCVWERYRLVLVIELRLSLQGGPR